MFEIISPSRQWIVPPLSWFITTCTSDSTSTSLQLLLIAGLVTSRTANASRVSTLSLRSFRYKPPTTYPFESRATTPMPPIFVCSHQEASQFMWMVPELVALHLSTSCSVWVGVSIFGILVRSSIATFISVVVTIGYSILPSNMALHRVFHICEQVARHIDHRISRSFVVLPGSFVRHVNHCSIVTVLGYGA